MAITSMHLENLSARVDTGDIARVEPTVGGFTVRCVDGRLWEVGSKRDPDDIGVTIFLSRAAARRIAHALKPCPDASHQRDVVLEYARRLLLMGTDPDLVCDYIRRAQKELAHGDVDGSSAMASGARKLVLDFNRDLLERGVDRERVAENLKGGQRMLVADGEAPFTSEELPEGITIPDDAAPTEQPRGFFARLGKFLFSGL